MGLWVSKNEGDREWRRPMRYLATTKNHYHEKNKTRQKRRVNSKHARPPREYPVTLNLTTSLCCDSNSFTFSSTCFFHGVNSGRGIRN